MDKFFEESSIHGLKGFHSSERKSVRIMWLFIYFLSFFGVGFYCYGIYIRCKVTPIIFEEANQVSAREIPIPAITICSPEFSNIDRKSHFNIKKLLSSPQGLNLSEEYQNHYAADFESCAPEMIPKILKLLLNANTSQKVQVLWSKNSDFMDFVSSLKLIF